MTPDTLKSIVEGALFAAGRALTIEQLQALFDEPVRPDAGSLRAVLSTIAIEHQ
ncbi:MAG: SMC-Scp complex subunit ScpB, partial [Acinetobacter sp.]|nr:SMC-Scp complex subunit ScpB [Acinetobacter sp.]